MNPESDAFDDSMDPVADPFGERDPAAPPPAPASGDPADEETPEEYEALADLNGPAEEFPDEALPPEKSPEEFWSEG